MPQTYPKNVTQTQYQPNFIPNLTKPNLKSDHNTNTKSTLFLTEIHPKLPT